MTTPRDFPHVRVEISPLTGYPHRWGYAIAESVRGGNHVEGSRVTRDGETSYLVARTKEGKGGALWFSADALRFPSGRPPNEARTRSPAWLEAMEANHYARELELKANDEEADGAHIQIRRPSLFAKRARATADALEVAADAWEGVGEERFANRARLDASELRAEAFKVTHRHLEKFGWYLVSDKEARALVHANRTLLPAEGYTLVGAIRLGFAGPIVDLRRIRLSSDEQFLEQQKRPWGWAVGSFRPVTEDNARYLPLCVPEDPVRFG